MHVHQPDLHGLVICGGFLATISSQGRWNGLLDYSKVICVEMLGG